MDSEKLLQRLVYLIFLIFLVNFVANKFHWYYSIWYFDMIMHFLGGAWLGLVSLWFFSRTSTSESFRLSPELVLKILLFVFFAGLGWEIFEFYFYNFLD